MNTKAKIIVALDMNSAKEAESLLRALEGAPVLCKIGLQLYTREGPSLVRALRERGLGVFLDLKLHDIPNTVRRTVEAIRDLDVQMTTVHATGGTEMLKAAADGAKNSDLLVLAVTVLTSSNDETLRSIGVARGMQEQVLGLAKLTSEAGIGGVVASPLEISAIRKQHGKGLKIVTPGIRPAGAEVNDQKRILTPRQAIEAGADWLVIGRPITAVPDPRAALEKIFSEIA